MKVRKSRIFYGYVIVAIAFAIMAIGVGGINSFGIFFAPILAEFGWSRALTSGAFSLCIILSGSLAMFTGRLNDRFGPRLLLTVCGFFLGLGYLLLSRLSAVWQLYLFYGVITGIGLSGALIPVLSTVSRWFARRRGMMTGIVLAGIGTGMLFMPLVVGWLISRYSWRTAVMAMGFITWGIVIISAQFFHRDPQSRGLLPDGETEVKQEHRDLNISGLSVREAVRTRELWMLWAAFLCVGFATYAIMVHIVIHATGLGIPATRAGNVLAILGGFNILGRFVTGSASDRIGGRTTLRINLSLMLATLVWLLFAQELWMLLLFGAVFGLAYSASALEAPMVADFFGLKSHGVLFGIVDWGLSIGATIGPVLTGYIYDVTQSYQVAFLLIIGVIIIGLILTWLLKSGRRDLPVKMSPE